MFYLRRCFFVSFSFSQPIVTPYRTAWFLYPKYLFSSIFVNFFLTKLGFQKSSSVYNQLSICYRNVRNGKPRWPPLLRSRPLHTACLEGIVAGWIWRRETDDRFYGGILRCCQLLSCWQCEHRRIFSEQRPSRPLESKTCAKTPYLPSVSCA